MLPDLTAQQLLLRLAGAILVSAVHGLALAAAARAFGDRGPEHDGRITANPFAHVDLLGAACAGVFMLGWGKPVAIDPAALRNGRAGLVGAVLAATAATLVFAVAIRLLRLPIAMYLPDAAALTLAALINVTADLALWFALLNLVPVPPLTGFHLTRALAPGVEPRLEPARRFLPAALAILVFSGLPMRLLMPLHERIAGWLLPA